MKQYQGSDKNYELDGTTNKKYKKLIKYNKYKKSNLIFNTHHSVLRILS